MCGLTPTLPNPGSYAPLPSDEADELLVFLAAQGLRHESRVVSELMQKGRKVIDIEHLSATRAPALPAPDPEQGGDVGAADPVADRFSALTTAISQFVAAGDAAESIVAGPAESKSPGSQAGGARPGSLGQQAFAARAAVTVAALRSGVDVLYQAPLAMMVQRGEGLARGAAGSESLLLDTLSLAPAGVMDSLAASLAALDASPPAKPLVAALLMSSSGNTYGSGGGIAGAGGDGGASAAEGEVSPEEAMRASLNRQIAKLERAAKAGQHHPALLAATADRPGLALSAAAEGGSEGPATFMSSASASMSKTVANAAVAIGTSSSMKARKRFETRANARAEGTSAPHVYASHVCIWSGQEPHTRMAETFFPLQRLFGPTR